MSGKICEDCSALEDGEIIAIVVNNGGDSTIWREFREPRFFLNVLADIDTLPHVVLAICCLQLLQNNRSLVSVRSSPSQQLNARFGNEAGRSVGGRHCACRS